MCVDHSGRALSITRGFPGTYNDKTIARYDSFLQSVHQGGRYAQEESLSCMLVKVVYKLTKDCGSWSIKAITVGGCYNVLYLTQAILIDDSGLEHWNHVGRMWNAFLEDAQTSDGAEAADVQVEVENREDEEYDDMDNRESFPRRPIVS